MRREEMTELDIKLEEEIKNIYGDDDVLQKAVFAFTDTQEERKIILR